MAITHGVAYWPGVKSPIQCTYSCSHGITPGVAILSCLPQDELIAAQGDLVLFDGNVYIRIPNARLQELKVSKDSSGTLWHLEIVDRRWKWREFGVINGCYNQRSYRNYVFPWTLAYPKAQFAACLDAMGEKNYQILIPNPLRLIPVNWDYINPARALEDLANELGCRVIYRLDTDSVVIMPLGTGVNALPPGSINKEGPSQKTPNIPDSIMLIGAPIRYQCQFRLTAVGEEWDGSIRELDQLSYAPLATNQVSQVTWVSPILPDIIIAAAYRYSIQIEGYKEITFITALGVAFTLDEICDGFVVLINAAQPGPFGNGFGAPTPAKVTAKKITANGFPTVQITGNANGQSFSVSAQSKVIFVLNPPDPHIEPDIKVELITEGHTGSNRFSNCFPPDFLNVRATERLTLYEAREKARKSVYKWYAIMNQDIVTNKYPANVPGFGKLVRIFQIIPESIKVEFVIPQPGDDVIIDKQTGEKKTISFYDGFSREVPAQCFGSFCAHQAGVYAPMVGQANTDVNQIVDVPFEINHDQLVVQFGQYIWHLSNISKPAPSLRLECAVTVRHPITNQVVRFQYNYIPPGPKAGTGPAIFRHDDLKQWYVARYQPINAINEPMVYNIYPMLSEAVDSGPGVINRYTVLIQGYDPISVDVIANLLPTIDLICSQLVLAINAAKPGGIKVTALQALEVGGDFFVRLTGPPDGKPFTVRVSARRIPPRVPEDITLIPFIRALLVQQGNIGSGNVKLDNLYNNLPLVNQEALFYLMGHLNNYQIKKALTRAYNGLVPIVNDGSVHQVTWRIGPDGTFTEASLHIEHSDYIPSFPERRKLEYLSSVQQNSNPLVRPKNTLTPEEIAILGT